MSIAIEEHPWFTPWTDPTSGITSYVLTERVTPMQRGIYHTVTETSADGSRFWFLGLRPPSKVFSVCSAALTPDGGTMRSHEVATVSLSGTSPLVAPDGRSAKVVIDDALYRLEADSGELTELFAFPGLGPGVRLRAATHVTCSCDGRYHVFDSQFGNRTVIWYHDGETGEHRELYAGFTNFHHTLCSPVDPDWILLGQGPETDPISGAYAGQHWRAWLMTVDGSRFEMVLPDQWCGGPHGCGHEFWAGDGSVHFCNQRQGVFAAGRPEGPRERVHLWHHPITHARCTADRSLFVGDTDPYGWTPDHETCSVHAFDPASGRQVAIASRLPFPTGIPLRHKRAYHFDPHPHFSRDERYAVWTTTVLGRIDLAFTPVAALREVLA